MKKKFAFFLVLLTAVSFCSSLVLGQGTLSPPTNAVDGVGKPKAFMKTLDQVEPRKLIMEIPYTIDSPGSYYLTQNLIYTNTSGTNGITIKSSDVLLDLRGFTIMTSPGSTSIDGVHVSSNSVMPYFRRNVVIQNGVIRGWDEDGIDAQDANDAKFIDLKIISNAQRGVIVGDNSLVERCSVRDNGSCGIETFAGGTVKDCKAYGNGKTGNFEEGIYCDSASKISGCTVNGNKIGLWANAFCTVSKCMVLWNDTNGINVGLSCRVEDNNTGYNAGAGIYVGGSGNRIQGNNVSDNDIGIHIQGAGNLIVQNSANGNLSTNILVEGANYYGRIIDSNEMSGSGFTNSSPWANFTY